MNAAEMAARVNPISWARHRRLNRATGKFGAKHAQGRA